MFKVHKNMLTISDSTTFIPVSTVHHYHTRYSAENFHRKQISKQYIKNLLKFQDQLFGQRSRKKLSNFHFLNLTNLERSLFKYTQN